MAFQFHPPIAALAKSLLAADPEQGVERRTEARYPADEPAELEIVSCTANPIFGTILDVSRSGLRVALPQRIDRGDQVKVKLHHNVIFGEVRYCRPVSGAFHAGIRIQDLVRPAGRENDHIDDDPLSLYAIGKGLTVPEVIEVRQHLMRCEACRARLGEKEAKLNPMKNRRRTILYPGPSDPADD
jgi:hypothetical protein